MKILLCHERFVFRFGADRVLLLLGKGLAERGHQVSIMANRYDRQIVNQFASQVIDVPETDGRYFYQNEDTAEWLRSKWESLFDESTRPDVVIVGGWPFFAAIPFFRSVCAEVIFIDFGAVPLDGYEGGALLTQQKLRQLRSEFLPMATRIVAISDFIRETQSLVDVGAAVPTQTILLGADHVDTNLWRDGQVAGADTGRRAVSTVAHLKSMGSKVIFALGRWETGCYKNSDEALKLLRMVRVTIPTAVLVILAERDIEIPVDLHNAVYPLGFPDDSELAEIMAHADLGVSLSRWEGFNLPIAEMQWIDRPVLALDLGAHPEVILDPWYLCHDTADMASRAVAVLSGQGIHANARRTALNGFRQRFTWSRMVEEFDRLMASGAQLIVDVTNSTRDPANSGVIRVTRRLSRELQRYKDPVFVIWDSDLNQYVLPTEAEFEQLGQFQGPLLTSRNRLSPSASSRVTLEETVEPFGCVNGWIIFPETMIETRFKPVRRYIRKLGLRSAAIFYDAIPILRPDLCNEEMRANHRDYMAGLAECDVVVPISDYSAQCLRDFWMAQGINGCEIRTDLLPGEFGGSERVIVPPQTWKRINILCVSTLEPRKNHRKLIEACLSLKQSHPELDWQLTLVGNKYHGSFDLADWVQEVMTKHPEIRWLGIVDDTTLQKLYEEAHFTVYPSLIEGFGMPILESIWHGRPCICSNTGVMAELAADGGCLTADVQHVEALADAIAELAKNRDLWRELVEQAIHRSLKTWDNYTQEFLELLSPRALESQLEYTASLLPTWTISSRRSERTHRSPVAWTEVLYPSCILENWQMHDGERLALTALLARLKPKCSIEIGTYYGGSLSVIAQYSEMVFSIDIDPEVADRVGPFDNVTYLNGPSSELLPLLFRELNTAGVPVDFILIDGDHSASGVKRDISLVLQYVPSKPMFVVLHDSFNPGCRQGMLDSPWHESPYCHWVELDLVSGRPVCHEGPAEGELWGGLAIAYLQPAVREGPLVISRSADTLFHRMLHAFESA
jgi:glycosyltransferase involved in cell wall biosynthesis